MADEMGLGKTVSYKRQKTPGALNNECSYNALPSCGLYSSNLRMLENQLSKNV